MVLLIRFIVAEYHAIQVSKNKSYDFDSVCLSHLSVTPLTLWPREIDLSVSPSMTSGSSGSKGLILNLEFSIVQLL